MSKIIDKSATAAAYPSVPVIWPLPKTRRAEDSIASEPAAVVE